MSERLADHTTTRVGGPARAWVTARTEAEAIEAVRAEGFDVCGVVSVLDRLSGGAEAIRLASGDAPYEPLVTIDDIYPDRPA